MSLLKRCSIPTDKLVRVFITCIRPVLEYSNEVWHYSLPQYLSDEIERIQRRARRIIFPELKYSEAMDRANVVTLFQEEIVSVQDFGIRFIVTHPTSFKVLTLPSP